MSRAEEFSIGSTFIDGDDGPKRSAIAAVSGSRPSNLERLLATTTLAERNRRYDEMARKKAVSKGWAADGDDYDRQVAEHAQDSHHDV